MQQSSGNSQLKLRHPFFPHQALFLQALKSLFAPYQQTIRQTLKLATPIIMGQLGVVLMGVADTLMVGRLGKDVLAAANQANNIFFMVSGLTFGIMFAISTLVSIKAGEGKETDTFITYRAGQWVALLLCVAQVIILEIIVSNFEWLGQQQSVNELTPGFLRILNLSVLPLLLALASRQYTDGLGHTKVAMAITFGGLALNILLNYLLIYGNWGFPALGMNGAAWATLIARICMALAGIWYVRYSGFLAKYRPAKMPSWKQIRLETAEIWKIGLPVGLQTFAEWACFSISGIMVGWLGSAQLAAHAVALNVASVAYMVVSGFAMAGGIMMGNAFGAQDGQLMRKVANTTLGIILVYELITCAIFLLFSHPIADLYGVDSTVMPIVLPLFFLAALFQIADGIQAGGMNLLRGITDVNWASVISVLSYWVVSLPLGYVMGLKLGWDVFGIWTGFTLGLFVAAIFGVWRFYYRLKVMKFAHYA
jgi:MATE family multidrug resistance protein